jgi:hypothetical protein
MALNVGLNASFDNFQDSKGSRDKAEKLKHIYQIMRFLVELSTGAALLYLKLKIGSGTTVP